MEFPMQQHTQVSVDLTHSRSISAGSQRLHQCRMTALSKGRRREETPQVADRCSGLPLSQSIGGETLQCVLKRLLSGRAFRVYPLLQAAFQERTPVEVHGGLQSRYA